MRRTVRLGIIGAGGIGRAHLDACRMCSGVALTAVCDVDLGRAQKAAVESGGARAFTNHREMLAEDVVDAVSVCTPNNTHMPITLDSINAGKDVLCEKPIALNAQQASRMVQAAKAACKILMTAQSARFSSASQYIKRLADAGRFGDLYYGKAVWFRRDGIPRGWFRDRKQAGGGPLIDLGVHAVDLLWWVMGQPKPVSAFGVTFDLLGRSGQGMGDWGVGYNGPGPRAAKPKVTVEDMVGAMIRLEDGRAISFDISWATHTADVYWIRVLGTKGGAQVQPEAVLYHNDGPVRLESIADTGSQNSYTAEMQHFVDCVQSREEPLCPGSQSIVVMAMLDAVAASARTGRMVRVNVPASSSPRAEKGR